MRDKSHYYNSGMWKGAPIGNFLKAKMLRINQTPAELIVWDKLKNNQIKGLKFRRQHPINVFIADFYCHKCKLVIEIDGKYHDFTEQKNKDDNRTKELNALGLTVIRFTNTQVENEINDVIQTIKDKIDEIMNLNP